MMDNIVQTGFDTRPIEMQPMWQVVSSKFQYTSRASPGRGAAYHLVNEAFNVGQIRTRIEL